MPSARWRAPATSDVRRNQRAKMVDPASDRFAADLDTALSQQFFDVTQAQREPKIEPDSMPDDVRRVPLTLERQGFRHLELQIGYPAESGDILALDCQHHDIWGNRYRLNDKGGVISRFRSAISRKWRQDRVSLSAPSFLEVFQRVT